MWELKLSLSSLYDVGYVVLRCAGVVDMQENMYCRKGTLVQWLTSMFQGVVAEDLCSILTLTTFLIII